MISIIIPTKNGARTIKRAIDSIERQTEKDLEIIVINDASTDNTLEVVTNIQRTDSRIILLSNEKSIGPGSARDLGIIKAQGELLAFIDDDDEWISPQKLQLQKEYLETHPEVVLVGSSRAEFVTPQGKPLRIIHLPTEDAAIRRQMLLRNPFLTSSVMLRKDAYVRSGGFSPLFLSEDYDLWLRLGLQGTLANLHNCDIRYTVQPPAKGRSNLPQMARITVDLIKKYYDKYPNYLPALIKGCLRILLLDFKHLF